MFGLGVVGLEVGVLRVWGVRAPGLWLPFLGSFPRAGSKEGLGFWVES